MNLNSIFSRRHCLDRRADLVAFAQERVNFFPVSMRSDQRRAITVDVGPPARSQRPLIDFTRQ